MPALIVIGGGIAGLSTAMLLARDGHHVTVLERDPAPPPRPAATPGRPGSVEASTSSGYRTCSCLASASCSTPSYLTSPSPSRPPAPCGSTASPTCRSAITGGCRRGDGGSTSSPGDGRWSRRRSPARPTAEPGVEIRRGIGVRGLVVERPPNGRPHVAGVVTDRGTLHGRPRRRRRWPALDARRVAGRRRCAGAGRGASRQRLRVLRPPLPIRRRGDAADARTAAAALPIAEPAHPSG